MKKERLRLQARCERIIDLEARGDELYRQEMGKLFRECTDAIEIIKWKEILQSVEDVTDECEDLVVTFRRVVLKYA